jgi:uncharacterized protein YcbX
MLHDAVEDPAAHSPAELRAAYERRLSSVVDERGVDAVAEASGVDADRLAALADGDSPELTVEEAAAVLAVEPGVDRDAVVQELRDHLLLGMTTGVLDVDTLAGEIDADLTGQEVQQAIEGRIPMTLAQLAELQRAIAARTR